MNNPRPPIYQSSSPAKAAQTRNGTCSPKQLGKLGGPTPPTVDQWTRSPGSTQILVTLLLLLSVFSLSACAVATYGEHTSVHSVKGIGYFYDSLTPYGVWVEVAPYGFVWRPNGVPIGWQPYSRGHWRWSTDGWLWVSDWRWGWAPFHYGRWFHDPYHGWVWVPGTVWAPAWTAWRYGGGWIGWAPLPPGSRWSVGVGLQIGDVELNAAIATHWWLFVGEASFLERQVHRRCAPNPRNLTILRDTRPITRYTERGRRVINHGPDADRLRTIRREALPAAELRSRDAPPKSTKSRRARPSDAPKMNKKY